MLLDPLDSEGSSGSRSRKIFIPADDLKAEGIIAGDLVRVSVQGSQQAYLFLQAWPSSTIPSKVGLLSPSHYASLQLPLSLEDGSSTSAALPKIDVRKVNVAKLSPKEARAVKLVEVAAAAASELNPPAGNEQQDETPAGEPKREDEWLEICLKQALVDLRYLTPATTVSVELPDTTRTFRLIEVDGEPLSSSGHPLAAEVGGLTAKLDRLDVNGATGKRAADQLWIVGWTLQFETEQLEWATPSTAENPSKGTTVSAGNGPAKGSSSPTSSTLPSFINVFPPSSTPASNYSTIGGLASQVALVRQLIDLPLQHPELFATLSLPPPRGILLYGPPGTGKTALSRAIASSTPGCSCIVVNGPELSGAYHGESEERLRAVWEEAKRRSPCVLVLDEIDALCPRRDGGEGGEVERRVVSQLLTLMDGMGSAGDRVVVIGATNRPNAIDPALRRPGRFDKEIEIGVPDATARLSILQTLLGPVPNALDEQALTLVSSQTHGYVGADLSSLIREAGTIAIQAHIAAPAERPLALTVDDLLKALPLVRPSAMREVFLEPPTTKWSDIGGQEDVKQKLKECVEWPLRYRDSFQRLGVRPPRGVLLYGPPGCSKTLTAKALATESGINFLAVKGPELLNKYVGESERAVREVFKKARAASPSIIFFDEIDALGTSREDSGSSHTSGILTSILNEMDGVEELVGVTVVAATNRPDVIDSALLRPGRIDRILYVGPPSLESRKEIFNISLRKMAVEETTKAEDLAALTDGCSGAEIVQICQDAALRAMNADINAPFVRRDDFLAVIKTIRRSITPEMIQFFEEWRDQSGGRSA